MVARNNMMKRGITNFNKKNADGSFFSKNWRDYITV